MENLCSGGEKILTDVVGGLNNQQIDVMDPEDPAAMSEYPDLDYVPIYPWVGEKTSEKDLYDTSPIENGEQDVDDQQQNDQDQDSRAVNQEIWSGRGKHRNEPYMDTDFHPSDENITYVHLSLILF